MPNKQFTNTYESQTKDKDISISDFGDSSFTSFMAQGRFKQTEVVEKGKDGGQDKTRKSVIDAVRNNIKRRMREVNADSRKSRGEMEGKHIAAGSEIIKLINKRRAIIKNRKRLEFEHKRLTEDRSHSQELEQDMIRYYSDIRNELVSLKNTTLTRKAATSSSGAARDDSQIQARIAYIKQASRRIAQKNATAPDASKKAASLRRASKNAISKDDTDSAISMSTTTTTTTTTTTPRSPSPDIDDDEVDTGVTTATSPKAKSDFSSLDLSELGMDVDDFDDDTDSTLSPVSVSPPTSVSTTTTTTTTTPSTISPSMDDSSVKGAISPSSDADDSDSALDSSAASAVTSPSDVDDSDLSSDFPALSDSDTSSLASNSAASLDALRTLVRSSEIPIGPMADILSDMREGQKLIDKMNLKRGPYFASLRIRSNRSDYNKTFTEQDDNAKAIKRKTDDWKKQYNKYSSTTVKSYDNTYDSLAKTWYELTHEYSVSELGKTPSAQEIADAMNKRSISASEAKNIEEYAGIYDMNGFQALYNHLNQNPYLPLTSDDLPKKNADANDTIHSSDPFTLIHDKISMYSSPDANGVVTEYLFDRNFFSTNTGSLVHAEDAKLTSDAVDLNNRYLYSETSSDIVSAKTSRTGERVYGFYLNGEFVTDEHLASPRERLSRASDMKYFGRKDWDKLAKADKLRNAIRSSPFFKHVNSATIQLYAGYNADVDYGSKIKEMFDNRYAQGQERPENQLKDTSLFPNARVLRNYINNLPASKKGDYIAAYILQKYESGAFTTDFISNDRILKLINDTPGIEKDIALRLLAEDGKTSLWSYARQLILNRPSLVSKRTMVMLRQLPARGEMMRVGLLDELVNHQGFFTEYDAANSDIMGLFHLPELRVYQEELMSKRGKRAWFDRNLLNGSLFNNALGAAMSGYAGIHGIIDGAASEPTTDKKGNKVESDYEVSDTEKRKRTQDLMWMEFGKTMAQGSRIMGLTEGLLAAGGAAYGATNLSLTETTADSFRASTIGTDAAYAVNGLDDLIKVVYKGFKACKHVYLMRNDPAYKAEHDQAKQNTLQSYTGAEGYVKEFCTWLQQLVSSLQNLFSIGGMESDNVITGKHYADPGTFSWKGPLFKIFQAIKDVLDLVNGIVDVVSSQKRINRLDATDNSIETVLDELQQSLSAPAGAPDTMTPQNRELANAALENFQAQFYLALAKRQGRKERSKAGFTIASSSVRFIADVLGAVSDGTNPDMMIASGVFTVAPSLIDFTSWFVTKVHYDIPNFNDSIAMMLGDKSYSSAPYFNDVLKRETGIVSKNYLLDLAKIFMTIDSHVLINDPKNPGQKAMGDMMLKSLYDNVDDTTRRTSKLSELLRYAGLSAGTNWRSLLRLSLTS